MGIRQSEFYPGRVVLAFLCVASVLVLTHLPTEVVPKGLPRMLQLGGSDKIVHSLAYALITASFLLAVKCRTDCRLWAIIILGIAAVGVADEVTQPLVNRDCSGWDWVADLIGIAAGCGVALLSCRGSRTAGLRRPCRSHGAAGFSSAYLT